MRQLQAEKIGRPGFLGLWILGKKQIHKVLGVVMARFLEMAGNSCLAKDRLSYS